MSGEIWVILSFLFFMLLFAGVGMASIRVKKDTTDDYLVAGRGMHPALAALSAVSTWNSGYMSSDLLDSCGLWVTQQFGFLSFQQSAN